MSRSREGAWIEISTFVLIRHGVAVAPARERGLKYEMVHLYNCQEGSRSREGAWIEIPAGLTSYTVASCRSREGAWIEMIRSFSGIPLLVPSLPRGSVD